MAYDDGAEQLLLSLGLDLTPVKRSVQEIKSAFASVSKEIAPSLDAVIATLGKSGKEAASQTLRLGQQQKAQMDELRRNAQHQVEASQKLLASQEKLTTQLQDQLELLRSHLNVRQQLHTADKELGRATQSGHQQLKQQLQQLSQQAATKQSDSVLGSLLKLEQQISSLTEQINVTEKDTLQQRQKQYDATVNELTKVEKMLEAERAISTELERQLKLRSQMPRVTKAPTPGKPAAETPQTVVIAPEAKSAAKEQAGQSAGVQIEQLGADLLVLAQEATKSGEAERAPVGESGAAMLEATKASLELTKSQREQAESLLQKEKDKLAKDLADSQQKVAGHEQHLAKLREQKEEQAKAIVRQRVQAVTPEKLEQEEIEKKPIRFRKGYAAEHQRAIEENKERAFEAQKLTDEQQELVNKEKEELQLLTQAHGAEKNRITDGIKQLKIEQQKLVAQVEANKLAQQRGEITAEAATKTTADLLKQRNEGRSKLADLTEQQRQADLLAQKSLHEEKLKVETLQQELDVRKQNTAEIQRQIKESMIHVAQVEASIKETQAKRAEGFIGHMSEAIFGGGFSGRVARGVLGGTFFATAVSSLGLEVAHLVEELKEAIIEGGQFSQIQNVFRGVAGSVQSANEFLSQMREESEGMISDVTLMQLGTAGLSHGYKLTREEVVKLSGAIADLAEMHGKMTPEAGAQTIERMLSSGYFSARGIGMALGLTEAELKTFQYPPVIGENTRMMVQSKSEVLQLIKLDEQLRKTGFRVPLTIDSVVNRVKTSFRNLFSWFAEGFNFSQGTQMFLEQLNRISHHIDSFKQLAAKAGKAMGYGLALAVPTMHLISDVLSGIVDIIKSLGGVVAGTFGALSNHTVTAKDVVLGLGLAFDYVGAAIHTVLRGIGLLLSQTAQMGPVITAAAQVWATASRTILPTWVPGHKTAQDITASVAQFASVVKKQLGPVQAQMADIWNKSAQRARDLNQAANEAWRKVSTPPPFPVVPQNDTQVRDYLRITGETLAKVRQMDQDIKREHTSLAKSLLEGEQSRIQSQKQMDDEAYAYGEESLNRHYLNQRQLAKENLASKQQESQVEHQATLDALKADHEAQLKDLAAKRNYTMNEADYRMQLAKENDKYDSQVMVANTEFNATQIKQKQQYYVELIALGKQYHQGSLSQIQAYFGPQQKAIEQQIQFQQDLAKNFNQPTAFLAPTSELMQQMGDSLQQQMQYLGKLVESGYVPKYSRQWFTIYNQMEQIYRMQVKWHDELSATLDLLTPLGHGLSGLAQSMGKVFHSPSMQNIADVLKQGADLMAKSHEMHNAIFGRKLPPKSPELRHIEEEAMGIINHIGDISKIYLKPFQPLWAASDRMAEKLRETTLAVDGFAAALALNRVDMTKGYTTPTDVEALPALPPSQFSVAPKALTTSALEHAIAAREGFYVSGTLPKRLNNPGDIEYGPWAAAHGGMPDKSGKARFTSAQAGWDAMRQLLESSSYASLTLAKAIERWMGRMPTTAAQLKGNIDYKGLDLAQAQAKWKKTYDNYLAGVLASTGFTANTTVAQALAQEKSPNFGLKMPVAPQVAVPNQADIFYQHPATKSASMNSLDRMRALLALGTEIPLAGAMSILGLTEVPPVSTKTPTGNEPSVTLPTPPPPATPPPYTPPRWGVLPSWQQPQSTQPPASSPVPTAASPLWGVPPVWRQPIASIQSPDAQLQATLTAMAAVSSSEYDLAFQNIRGSLQRTEFNGFESQPQLTPAVYSPFSAARSVSGNSSPIAAMQALTAALLALYTEIKPFTTGAMLSGTAGSHYVSAAYHPAGETQHIASQVGGGLNAAVDKLHSSLDALVNTVDNAVHKIGQSVGNAIAKPGTDTAGSDNTVRPALTPPSPPHSIWGLLGDQFSAIFHGGKGKYGSGVDSQGNRTYGSASQALQAFTGSLVNAVQGVAGFVTAITSAKNPVAGALGGLTSGMGMANMMGFGPIGMAVGAAAGAITGTIVGEKNRQIQRNIDNATANFKLIMGQYAQNNNNLNQTVQEIQAIIDQLTIEKNNSKKGQSKYQAEITQYVQQVGQLQDQQMQTLNDMYRQSSVLQSPFGMQDTLSQLQSILEQYDKFAGAARNAAELADANTYLAGSLAKLEQSTLQTFQQNEEQAINDAIQLNDLLYQRWELTKQYNDQVQSVLAQGVLTRQLTMAQSKGQKIEQMTADYQRQMQNLNEQIQVAQYRVQAERQIFNLATTRTDLEMQLAQIQEQSVNLDMQRIAALAALVQAMQSGNWSFGPIATVIQQLQAATPPTVNPASGVTNLTEQITDVLGTATSGANNLNQNLGTLQTELSQATGSLGASAGQLQSTAYATAPGMAGGGPIAAGMRVEVNEKGQEFFIPDTNGFVVPASSQGTWPSLSQVTQPGAGATVSSLPSDLLVQMVQQMQQTNQHLATLVQAQTSAITQKLLASTLGYIQTQHQQMVTLVQGLIQQNASAIGGTMSLDKLVTAAYQDRALSGFSQFRGSNL